jgi:hypothetical protein
MDPELRKENLISYINRLGLGCWVHMVNGYFVGWDDPLLGRVCLFQLSSLVACLVTT